MKVLVTGKQDRRVMLALALLSADVATADTFEVKPREITGVWIDERVRSPAPQGWASCGPERTEKMEAGKHDFDGNCAPGTGGEIKYFSQETFSVGVFQWVPKNSGKGCKRGAVKVRVKGSFDRPASVYAKAREIANALDAGTYNGPKHVTVS